MTTLTNNTQTSQNLIVNDLTVTFGNKTIFSSISFALEQGEIGCLLGQSGCGKTTVLRSIMGFCQPQNGTIHLANKLLYNAQNKQNIAPHLRHIGMVFQDYALFSHLTVADNICFGIKHLAKNEQKTRLDELLTLVGMEDFARRYPHELSGGQQQRVALARAFALKPNLILLDEPFSNLDVELRASLSFEVRELLKSQNTTAILVTHDQAEAFAMADKIGVMANGQLQQWDTPTNLYQKPASQAVASFVGEGVLFPIQNVLDNQTSVQTAVGIITCENANDAQENHHVLIRPEQVIISSDGIPVTLHKLNFKGSYWQANLLLATGEEVLAHLPTHMTAKVGDTLKVQVKKGWVV
ncbi:ABC transporter ATP-binding protein [Moraxella sp. ZY210820]|uniref:ABC transporter ATP-binding protein n=1 Tax=unclassified Moraxella TaxID=2685852 RepID=UPI00272F8EAA|nr:ABC transporter ATP-binding protein [Moraxella sp. ZY210820]WLF83500.1 ABC transporter ATP-binding protein [Moraxella sp. ZY210820]